MSKIHYRDLLFSVYMPRYVIKEYQKRGERGAFCGYFRKNTTLKKDEVTCFYCLNALKKLETNCNRHKND